MYDVTVRSGTPSEGISRGSRRYNWTYGIRFLHLQSEDGQLTSWQVTSVGMGPFLVSFLKKSEALKWRNRTYLLCSMHFVLGTSSDMTEKAVICYLCNDNRVITWKIHEHRIVAYHIGCHLKEINNGRQVKTLQATVLTESWMMPLLCSLQF